MMWMWLTRNHHDRHVKPCLVLRHESLVQRRESIETVGTIRRLSQVLMLIGSVVGVLVATGEQHQTQASWIQELNACRAS